MLSGYAKLIDGHAGMGEQKHYVIIITLHDGINRSRL
jgi:hypothetical protein